jgi:cob(I)alamin adenosyltransferase
MSIATKTGDSGTTSLMYKRRVSKADLRVEACGCVDELNSALGLARATGLSPFVQDHLYTIQKDLVGLMGELATVEEDWPRYVRDGFAQLSAEQTARLDQLVKDLEARQISFQGWATPGASLPSATLDLARTICRRAERRVCALSEKQQLPNNEIVIYLNRLSDVLWLLARFSESQPPLPAG